MCLIVHKDAEIEIAKIDITVYKIVERFDKIYSALYQDFVYKKNKLYSINRPLVLSGQKGSHFDSKEGIAAFTSSIPIYDFRWVYEGYHFAFIKERLYDCCRLDYRICIVECTIPKGSKFIRGIDNLLGVSDAIILH